MRGLPWCTPHILEFAHILNFYIDCEHLHALCTVQMCAA